MSVVKIGPFGGTGGRMMDINPNHVPAQLNSIMIWHNEPSGIITAISFRYTTDQGNTFTVPDKPPNVWGDQRSSQPHTIEIDNDEDEYVTKIEGSHNGTHLSSLRITTNKKTSRWFGNQSKGHQHQFSVPLHTGGILGFFVRASTWINAIGVYVGPIDQ
ncbi:horcolin-like [Oryza brachyantha]|uniref:Jacalin-type lectin domain-containing protein n=1 Tax=Oryza brachyantha TaxID=4533 RepID=J3N6A9_ORYBR|nr:horcolin-like [Oryza brachyantha]